MRPDRLDMGISLGVLATAWAQGSTRSRMKITCGQKVQAGASRRVSHPSTPAESTLLAGAAAAFAELGVFNWDVNGK